MPDRLDLRWFVAATLFAVMVRTWGPLRLVAAVALLSIIFGILLVLICIELGCREEVSD